MAKQLTTIVFLLTLFSSNVYSQNDIEFLVKRIKTGYAGYQDKIKGNPKKFDAFVNAVIAEENLTPLEY